MRRDVSRAETRRDPALDGLLVDPLDGVRSGTVHLATGLIAAVEETPGARRAAVRLPRLRRPPDLRLARKRETGDHRLSGHGRHVRTRGGRAVPRTAARRSGVPRRPRRGAVPEPRRGRRAGARAHPARRSWRARRLARDRRGEHGHACAGDRPRTSTRSSASPPPARSPRSATPPPNHRTAQPRGRRGRAFRDARLERDDRDQGAIARRRRGPARGRARDARPDRRRPPPAPDDGGADRARGRRGRIALTSDLVSRPRGAARRESPRWRPLGRRGRQPDGAPLRPRGDGDDGEPRPGASVGLDDRGRIAPGYRADLAVLDATSAPARRSSGARPSGSRPVPAQGGLIRLVVHLGSIGQADGEDERPDPRVAADRADRVDSVGGMWMRSPGTTSRDSSRSSSRPGR